MSSLARVLSPVCPADCHRASGQGPAHQSGLSRVACLPTDTVSEHVRRGGHRRISKDGEVQRIAGTGIDQGRALRPLDPDGGGIGDLHDPVQRDFNDPAVKTAHTSAAVNW